MRFLVAFVVLAAAVAGASAQICQGKGTHGNLYANAHWASQKLGEVPFLGSHDAGCYHLTNSVGHSKSALAKWSWAVTQTQDFTGQLCNGYRVFDIRFKKAGTGHNDWRIFHGGYVFDDMITVANHFKNWAQEANVNRKNEVVILRTKVKGCKNTACSAFLKDWHAALGDGAVSGATALNGVIVGQTITQIQALRKVNTGNAANLIVLTYLDDEHKPKATDPADAVYQNLNFPYPDNMLGKFSASNIITYVVDKQKTAYDGWNPTNGKLFGYWVTSTGFKGKSKNGNHLALDIVKNSENLFDTVGTAPGKYHGWGATLIHQCGALGHTFKGLVIWTDFAGDAKFASLVTAFSAAIGNLQTANTALNHNIAVGGHQAKEPLTFFNAKKTANFLEVNAVAAARARVVAKRNTVVAHRLLRASAQSPAPVLPEDAPQCNTNPDEVSDKNDPNCVVFKAIPIDSFDECDEDPEAIQAVIDLAQQNYCVLCSQDEVTPVLDVEEATECAKRSNVPFDPTKLVCCRKA